MIINNNDTADKTIVNEIIHNTEQDRILIFQELFRNKYKIFLKYEKLFAEVAHTYNGIIITTDIFDYTGNIIYLQDTPDIRCNIFQLLAYCCMFKSIELDDNIEKVLYACRDDMKYRQDIFLFLKDSAKLKALRDYINSQLLLYEMAGSA